MSMQFVAWLNELRAKFAAQEQKIEELTERVKALEQADIRRPAVVLSGKRNG